jgi:hypothetical protein
MKLSAILKKVIGLSEAIRDYWETELPKAHPDYPIVRPGDKTVPPPPEEQQLRDFLTSLPEDVLEKLIVIVLNWRGFGTTDLADDYRTMKERYDGPEELVSVLVDEVALGDDLIDGLAELKKKKIDVDKLSWPPVKAKK